MLYVCTYIYIYRERERCIHMSYYVVTDYTCIYGANKAPRARLAVALDCDRHPQDQSTPSLHNKISA